MKSAVAKQKETQGWVKESPKCGNCENFKSEIEKHCWVKEGPKCGNYENFKSEIEKHDKGYWKYKREKNLRCCFSESMKFATNKTAWCRLHKWKTEERG